MKHTLYRNTIFKKYKYRSNLHQLGVGGNNAPKNHATNTNGIEGLRPPGLANFQTE
jgi:hypothetical protein